MVDDRLWQGARCFVERVFFDLFFLPCNGASHLCCYFGVFAFFSGLRRSHTSQNHIHVQPSRSSSVRDRVYAHFGSPNCNSAEQVLVGDTPTCNTAEQVSTWCLYCCDVIDQMLTCYLVLVILFERDPAVSDVGAHLLVQTSTQT